MMWRCGSQSAEHGRKRETGDATITAKDLTSDAPLRKHLRIRHRCGNVIILELKAMENINDAHIRQLLNYLRASRLKIGLLLNFGTPRLGVRRVLA